MKTSTLIRHARLWDIKQAAKRAKQAEKLAEKQKAKAEAKAAKKFARPVSLEGVPDNATAAQVLARQKALRIARERREWLAAGGRPTEKEDLAIKAQQATALATLQAKLAKDTRRENRLERKIREITNPPLTAARLAQYFALAPETFAGLVVKPGGELEEARIFTKGRNYRIGLGGRFMWANKAIATISAYWKKQEHQQ